VLAVLLGSSALLLSLPDSQVEYLADDWTLRHWLLDARPLRQPTSGEIEQVADLPWWSRRRIEVSFANGVAAYLPIFHRNLDLHEKLLIANTPELSLLAELQKPLILPGEPDNPAGITLGRRNANLVNIKGLDLQNRDLRFANLSKAKLWKADLRGVQLQHSNLSEAQLAGMLYDEKSQLQGANLSSIRLEGEDLRGLQLQAADLGNASLQGAYLSGVGLQGAHLGWAGLQGAYLRDARLQGADLSQASLQGADLRDADLQGAYLGGTVLQGADLRGVGLQGADLPGASLIGADLRSAHLQGASLRGVQAGSADFEQADLQGNNVSEMDITTTYNQVDFNDWKQHAREWLKRVLNTRELRELKEREIWLASRAGQAPVLPQQGWAKPCLADAKLQPNPSFQSCQTPAEDSFMALADFLGELACSAQSDAEEQSYITQGIAERALDVEEWDEGSQAARRKLAQRLLQADCAGKAGLAYLSDNQRNALRKLAEAR
jgi:uncharacterized protein YjbI with pentapeptide repeats